MNKLLYDFHLNMYVSNDSVYVNVNTFIRQIEILIYDHFGTTTIIQVEIYSIKLAYDSVRNDSHLLYLFNT